MRSDEPHLLPLYLAFCFASGHDPLLARFVCAHRLPLCAVRNKNHNKKIIKIPASSLVSLSGTNVHGVWPLCLVFLNSLGGRSASFVLTCDVMEGRMLYYKFLSLMHIMWYLPTPSPVGVSNTSHGCHMRPHVSGHVPTHWTFMAGDLETGPFDKTKTTSC
jgi:hypothetical protein